MDSEKQLIRCVKCKYCAYKPSDIIRHTISKHSKRLIKCKDCNFKCFFKIDIVKHNIKCNK